MNDNRVNTFAKTCLASVFAITLAGCGGGSDTTTATTIVEIDTTQPVSDWSLVWSDEFDGDALNLNNWTFEVDCRGGGNQERQCYTDSPENLSVSDGILTITALPAPEGAQQPYTSARINTKGKADFRYGRIEISAKMPEGQGTWPAFWMLPTDEVHGGWPKSGEIDILETVNLKTVNAEGVVENNVYGTLHYGDDWPRNQSSGKAYSPPNGLNPADDFNTYAIEWQEGEIRWYFNGHLYAMQRASEVRFNRDGTPIGLVHRGWYVPGFDPVSGDPTVFYGPEPFDQFFHLILNLAVGGAWPENTNLGGIDATAFENGQRLQVDWIRVYECRLDPQTGKGCETIRPGYDDPEDAFVEGKAPAPTPPAPPVAIPVTIFADAVNPNWPLWDCCGGTTPEVVMDDPEYGSVAEFRINDNNGTVLGFNSRLGEPGEPYNAGAMIGVGSLKFDMKVVSDTATPTTWLLKVESDNNTSFAELPLSESAEGAAPQEGDWQSYTFPIQQLADLGLDVGAIDVIMIFPLWQTGAGAVYRVDNVRIEQDDLTAESPQLVLFEETPAPGWDLWDCCGGTTPTIEIDEDDAFGPVAEFRINDNNGTVLGFNSRDNGQPFDASAILVNGVFKFDMKIVSPTAGETTWLMKIESNGAETAVELPLASSMEGVAPAEGQWQTYTYSLAALADAGLDVSAIDVVMVFPLWQTGAGAVYRIDNAKIYDPTAIGGPRPPSGPLLRVFADEFNAEWPAWDCCGGTTPTVEMDDAEHGATVEFRINDNNGTVLGFNSRDAGQPFDASAILTTGVLQFEMKVVNAPSSDTTWLLKVEADGNTSFAEVALNTSQEGVAPSEGQWQTYTFDLLSLSDAGLDVGAIDVIMIFPTWGTGAGAVYRVDNVYIGNPSDISGTSNGGSSGVDNAAFTVFANQVNEAWPLWDCCGGSTPTVEMDDAEHGAVAEFRISGNAGTVMGFYSRDAGQPYDASNLLLTGKFQFEMKIVSPAEGDTWLMKIEADGNTSFAELPLSASNEGAAPVVGQWQTYTFDLLTLADAGLDVGAIDVIMVFPVWGTGNGAIYRLDNVVFLED